MTYTFINVVEPFHHVVLKLCDNHHGRIFLDLCVIKSMDKYVVVRTSFCNGLNKEGTISFCLTTETEQASETSYTFSLRN